MRAEMSVERSQTGPHTAPMFAATCSTCGSRSLFANSRILDVHRTDDGFETRYLCWCGAQATFRTAVSRRRRLEPSA